MTSRAKAMTLLRGYTAEAEDAYAEAFALVKEHGEVPQLFPVLRNLASFYGYRGELDKAIAVRARRSSSSPTPPTTRACGSPVTRSSARTPGSPVTSRAGLGYLDQAIATFESSDFVARRLRLGLDPRVSCLTTSGFFLWLLGYPDRAAERAERAVAVATDLDHPYSLAYAYYHAGFLHLWRREPDVVAERAESALRVAETSDLALWRALATVLLGAATSAQGGHAEGIRRMADGIDQYQGLRTPPIFWPMLRWMQAAAHVDAETPGPGFPMIDEAIEIGGSDTIIAPLFHVVRGDLSLLGPDADPAAATASYERAFGVATSVGSRMTQLRAAARLVRMAPASDRARRAGGAPSGPRDLHGRTRDPRSHGGRRTPQLTLRPDRGRLRRRLSRQPGPSRPGGSRLCRGGGACPQDEIKPWRETLVHGPGLTNYLVVTKLTRMTTQTPQRTRMTADERREAIVAAATEEFANGGLVGASTEAIARRAGVSQPYIFQLFGTKKDLFLAVIRSCFGRTRLAFEEAARTYVPGAIEGCDSVLDAIGASYMRLLADRTLLLVQLQGYAACADPEVRSTVREEFAALHRRVQELSGASPEEMLQFFAHGMLLNVAAAVDFSSGLDKHWFIHNLEGRA